MQAAGGRVIAGEAVAVQAARPEGRGRVGTYAPAAARVVAASLVFLGLLHVLFGESLTRMLPVWSDGGPPGRPVWTPVMGALLAGAAGLSLARPDSRRATLLLAAVLLLPVLFVQLPRAVMSGRVDHEWLNVFKWLAMASGPLVLAAARPRDGSRWRDRIVDTGAASAPWLVGLFMFHSAVQHVQHAEFVAQLMQPWMPWRHFWVFFAAAALASGGVGLVVPRTARLAALLASLMIFSWFWLVHLPRMLIAPTGPVGWSEMGESLAFAALAFLLAARREHRDPGVPGPRR